MVSTRRSAKRARATGAPAPKARPFKKVKMTKKARAAQAVIDADPQAAAIAKQTREKRVMRRNHKLEVRRETKRAEKRGRFDADWDLPAPPGLVARLDLPKVKSKYRSYYEFAENAEKQEKKLEFQVTNQVKPTAGYTFVPIGNPALTQKCKELSRERDAMIFIVSNRGKEEGSRISQHIYRMGYHFRETLVDEARAYLGETVISKLMTKPGIIEPIPETQAEIDKQADGAIRDLFPRIPNTDRQMIIEHSFQKGKDFHGEPTVGLAADLPLSRRVQMAVLAHIRHTHTRYDKLLRETTWVNARKVVEPVCLDVLVKWRGDEETGRDQLDEILREVVIITDSEDEDDDDDDDDSSGSDEYSDDEDEGEATSASSPEPLIVEPPVSTIDPRIQMHIREQGERESALDAALGRNQNEQDGATVSARTRAKANPKSQEERMRQKGFKRYQEAYEDAMHRRQGQIPVGGPAYPTGNAAPPPGMYAQNMQAFNHNQVNSHASSSQNQGQYAEARHAPGPAYATIPETYYVHSRSPPHGNEVNLRSQPVQSSYHSYTQPRANSPSFVVRERPSRVVRGSPVGQTPEDTPLPSIEPSSTFALSRPHVSGNLHGGFSHTQDNFPRRVVEQRLQSPPQRQVIVIDDSPQVKRRRVVCEDDVGHFRADPVLSHGQNFHVAAPARPSHFISNSSVESGNFSSRMIESQGTQGLSRPRQRVYIDPVTSEELPVFDEPSMGNFAPRQPAPARPLETGYTQEIRRDMVQAPSAYAYHGQRTEVQPAYPQPVYADARPLRVEAVRADERRVDDRRAVPVQYHDMQQNVMRTDRDLAHSLSQSRLDGPVPSSNNDFIILHERAPQQSVAGRSNHVQYHENRSRPVQYVSRTRPRSPVMQFQRPIVRSDRQQVPLPHYDPQFVQPAYARVEAAPQYQQQLSSGRATYVRSTEPRRQVIVLD